FSQSPAHLEARNFRDDPVDKVPPATIDERARADGGETFEYERDLAVHERLEIAAVRMSGEYGDPVHRSQASFRPVVARRCDALMTATGTCAGRKGLSVSEPSVQERTQTNPCRSRVPGAGSLPPDHV